MSDENTPENPDELQPETVDPSPESEGVDVPVVEALQDEIDQLKEDKLRMAAEAQNVRRRAEADVEKARKFGTESLIKDLLPVLDSFDRALEAARVMEGFDAAMLEGMEATAQIFKDTLSKQGLTPINPTGEAFDPNQHQAISMVPGEAPANTVIDVVQTGYDLNGRVMRPAMVVVSQGGAGVDENA